MVLIQRVLLGVFFLAEHASVILKDEGPILYIRHYYSPNDVNEGEPRRQASDQRGERESGLSRSIARLFALAEDYPDLKASASFQQLHSSLVEIEDHLQYARRYYNGSVRDNNNMVEGFPSLVVASLFRFRAAKFFEIELAAKRATPRVDLD